MQIKHNYKILSFWLALLFAFLLTGCDISEIATENNTNPYSSGITEIATENNITPNTNENFKLTVLNVGDGAAQIVQVDGFTMVVDVGESTETEKVRSYLDSLNINKIDAVVMSHGHSDHIGGYKALSGYEIGTGYISPQPHSTATYENAIELMKNNSEKIVIPVAGESFDLGSAEVKFLGPHDKEYDDLNNSSLVLQITYGDTSFMLPGDMEGIEANQVIADFDNIETDVYIAAHHGSNNDATNSYTLLRAVNPWAVIISSAGAESEYGFPHKEVLSRINDIGATLYRTDFLGDIIVISDGKNITFNSEGTKPEKEHANGNGLAEDTAYIGNINSKKLHKSDCKNLPNEENRVYFNSLNEALNAGYELCKSCN